MVTVCLHFPHSTSMYPVFIYNQWFVFLIQYYREQNDCSLIHTPWLCPNSGAASSEGQICWLHTSQRQRLSKFTSLMRLTNMSSFSQILRTGLMGHSRSTISHNALCDDQRFFFPACNVGQRERKEHIFK